MNPSVLDTAAVFADGSGNAQGGGGMFFIVIIAMFVLMYFMMIRPQQKRQKQHKAMLEALEKGNEVLTNGGIAGRVERLGEQFVTVEIAPDVSVKLQRSAIAKVLPKGTLKSADQ